ncbi:MAG TPA: MotA/TolQ/ExbB proton channel family protein [Geminicoccaceae bacterium]|nr:MotA/TolQ/ExbB proton channel family protein [Geminicoccaceae bacterium]
MRLRNRALTRVDSEHLLLLKGLLLWAVIGVAFLAAWRYGLLQRVWQDDSTGLSVAITLVFLVVAARGSWHVLKLSRALNHVAEVRGAIMAPQAPELDRSDRSRPLPKGCVSEYIQTLHIKAKIGGHRGAIDQGLLLDAFEADLRSGHELGWFVADLLLSLGLLGTVIGFILMLGPISDLDTSDQGAIRTALAAMSGGMAVALYTTLTGLIGGLLLKVQGFLLDGAVQELVRRTTQLTEIYILPTIERRQLDATV